MTLVTEVLAMFEQRPSVTVDSAAAGPELPIRDEVVARGSAGLLARVTG